MPDNIVERGKAQPAYTKLLFPLRAGKNPTVFWILEERKDGWLAERPRMWSNADMPAEPEFLSFEDWTGSESLAQSKRLPDIDLDK